MKPARALAVAFVLALLHVASVGAHSLLVRSNPESNAELIEVPATIDMWFSEPLETSFTDARLIGSSGEEVPTGAAFVDTADPTHLTLPLGNLTPGIYTVAWQTLSQVDGHEWFGSFPITLLNPDGSDPGGVAAQVTTGGRGDLPTIGETGTRWLALTGSMLVFGSLLFRAIVMPESRTPELRINSFNTILAVIAGSLTAVMIGSTGQALLQSSRLGGLSELAELLSMTRTGSLILGRLFLSIVGMVLTIRISPHIRRLRVVAYVLAGISLIFIVALILSFQEGRTLIPLISLAIAIAGLAVAFVHRERQYIEPALWVISLALLISFSISSHAGAVEGSLIAVSGDLLHLIAASAWIGGLVLLPLIWVRYRELGLRAEFINAVRRFSLLAGASVFVILLTGLFNSFVEFPNLRSLWETPYGRVLLMKLTLVAMALLAAGWNNLRVRKLEDPERMASSIAFEAGIALVLLVAVAMLVQTPTPRSLSAPADSTASTSLPFNQITPTDDLNVHIQVDPNQTGSNRFWVHLYRNDGSDIGDVQLVRLFLEHAEQNLGRANVDLEPLGSDTFAVEGAFLSQPGDWDLSVYVRRRGVDDLLSDVRVEVPMGTGSSERSSVLGNPIPELAPQVLLGSVLIAAGSIPILWRRQFKGELARTYAIGIVLIVVGGVVFGLGLTRDSIPLSQRTNPTLPNDESLARGEKIYTESCSACHGIAGLGDGPLGVTLSPRPANLAVHMQPGVHTDGQILEWISNGFPNSSMPAFADTYSDGEIWDVINYIRTFAISEEE